jgi:pimeloyl-ACP methyl ester carboxylesterase
MLLGVHGSRRELLTSQMGAEVSGLYPVAMPERVRRVAIDTPRGCLAALNAWPPDNIPFQGTAVLVPGFGGSKEDFIPMLTPIAAAGYRVLCYDQRGQYESRGPTDVRAYSMKMFAEDLQVVIAAVAAGQSVHLVGHSFGGLVARRVVITASKSVRSLTLLDSGPDGASLPQARLLRLATWLIRVGGPRPVAAATCWAARRSGVPPARLPWLRHRLLATSPANLIGMCRAMAREPNLTESLASANVPVLVACGEGDDAWTVDTQIEMARRLGARIAVIEGAAHTPNEDCPEVTVDMLVKFWVAVDQ